MPATKGGKAVSDYEHLTHPLKQSNTFQPQNVDFVDFDLDTVPLKPSRSLNKEKNFHPIPQDLNMNNTSSVIQARDRVGLTQMLDDFGHLQAIDTVPSPAVWSPSMVHLSNPDLFVTPEKSFQRSKLHDRKGKENILEPHTNSTVPIPTAWSPGMVVKPNPALLITPDKTADVQITRHTSLGHHKVMDSLKDGTSRTKERPTVRFDLPSASSGEDTLDTSREVPDMIAAHQSPITLKGCDVDSDIEGSSPPWKAFSPQKAYNPSAYSDESLLDESMQSPPRSTQHQMKDVHPADAVEESTSDRLADKLQELLLSSAGSLNTKNDLLSPVSSKMSTKSSLGKSIIPSSQNIQDTEKPKAVSNRTTSRKVKSAASIGQPQRHSSSKSLSKDSHQINPKAGPQFLRAPPSPYEPKASELPETNVVRETGEGNSSHNNYSFPFEGGASLSQTEHAFARPEYNSTLRLGNELEERSRRKINVEKTVAETLSHSDDKRTELNEKASVYTNRMSNQFWNLVDLDPSVDSLCSRVVRMRTSKAKSKRLPSAPAKSTSASHAPPDLMEFLPGNLQKEAPDFSLPGIKPVTSRLQSARHDLAFDLYRHNRVWHGINDY